jgi:Tfp pilus assembly protein PilX
MIMNFRTRKCIKNDRVPETNRGFAMLFSVLVSSVLLSIGLSIFNLTVKELALSSSGRESQFSFYAADSGVECALYWDFKGQYIFATSSSSRTPSPSSPDCASQSININPSQTTSNSATTQFSFQIPNTLPSGGSAPYCVTVLVSKTVNNNIVSTTIDSRGYNTCDTNDPARVERALRVRY